MKTFRIKSNDLVRYELEEPVKAREESGITPSEPVCYYDWVRDESKSYSVHTRIPLIIVYNKDHGYNKVYVTLSVDSSSGIEAQLGIAYGYKLSSHGPDSPQLTLYFRGLHLWPGERAFYRYEGVQLLR